MMSSEKNEHQTKGNQRTMRTLQEGEIFGTTPMSFSEEKAYDLGRRRNERVGYLEGFR